MQPEDTLMPTKPIPIDLTRLLAPYQGEWVALSHDEKRILGHGKTIEDALATAKDIEGCPLLMKVSDDLGCVLV